MSTPRILWVDDEIDLLRPHVLFLESKGYAVSSVSNGADAVTHVREEPIDLVLLDEQMPGMGGLETLESIKEVAPELPVVMVTKSEEEDLMEEALGGKISDYLTKPVNPSQVLLTCKRLLDQERIRSRRVSQEFLQAFSQITRRVMGPMNHADWVDVYRELTGYDLELDDTDEGARQVLDDQLGETNRAFGRFVEERYEDWIADVDRPPDEDRPALSHEVVPRYVLPHVREQEKPVIFIVIDCMRYDQWLSFEELLRPYFSVERDFHYSILPTATPYSRNAIFSGLLPSEIASRFPRAWSQGEDDETSRNRNEEEFLQDLLDRKQMDARLRYDKLLGTDDGRAWSQKVTDLLQHDLSAVVVNFVDVLAHSRSDSDVLKEIAPDVPAYRALTRTWFEHSWLLEAFQELSRHDCRVVVTSDHGAVRCLHATKAIGDRETSTALRYKYGRNIKCEEKHAIYVRDPATFGLPAEHMNTNFIIAKEDYYFVYPTNYHYYEKLYRDTMQHGGASMEEMILPVATLDPK